MKKSELKRYYVCCWKCKVNYVKECTSEEFDKTKCPECKAKKQGWKKIQSIHPHQIRTKNVSATIIGTTSKRDNFEYRAKDNMDRAKGERRAAEAAQKNAAYNVPDDLRTMDEGIFDSDGPIRLS